MADPFSIINLLSTSATLITAVLKYALTVKQAPKELEELSCELTKLDGVLGRLVEHVERDERGEEFKEFPYLFNAAAVCYPPHIILSKSTFLSLRSNRTW